MYAWDIANNASCGATDVAFLSQLTTPNVARDLDRVRSALGESTLHLLGVSWGTYLGTVYRTLFPSHSGRMFLDSVAEQLQTLYDHEDDLRRRLARAEDQAAHPEMDEATLTAALGEETTRVLRSAHDAAHD